MKLRIFVFFAAVVLIIRGAAFAADPAVLLDVPAEAKAKYDEAEALRAKDKLNASYPIYAELLQKYSSSFSVNYGYGLLLAQMKRFPESGEALKIALNIGTAKEQILDPSIWNSIGWVAIMNGNFDQAIEYFKTAKNDPKTYASLREETKMKLHNNAGYALMLMDRYEEANEEFHKAELLGSEKAKENIEKIHSLIETQKKQDPDIPGVFTVVVLSVKNKDWLDKSIQSITGRIRSSAYGQELKDTDAIDVYLAKNGMYLLALGGNYSYAKAQRILEKVKKTAPDAFVSSTTNWEPYRIGANLPVPAAGAEKQE
jgi:tetratricopeptide (TPR) repeat protein